MLFQILTYVFVILVIAAIGPSATYAIWIQRAMANRDALPFTLRSIRSINGRVVIPATVLLLIVGIGIVIAEGLSFQTPWILLSLILWLANIVLGIFGYTPTLSKQIGFAESSGADSAEYKAAAWRGTIIGIVIGVIALVVLYLMMFQPSLWG